MSFAPVPTESRNQINKAGAILVTDEPDPREYLWAWDLANRWRACHAYPINTFQATLRTKLRLFKKDPIAAQRLKRMPTIIDKLKRYPAMKLSTMQDIGGVRAILATVRDVQKLRDEYLDNKRFTHVLTDHKDYIEQPRSEDGYRSVHLIYKYRNKIVPSYDGLRIELQIRTRLQHIWATAVESMGTFLGQALKSRRGDQEWLDFFALVSSAFAHMEKCTRVPRFAGLTLEDTADEISKSENRLNALEMMKGLSVAAKLIYSGRAGKGWSYHLIILNSIERTVNVKPYDRDSFDQALSDYSEVEEKAAKGEKIEPVLVSAGPMDQLRRAYPNFFLDINDFAGAVAQIVTKARK